METLLLYTLKASALMALFYVAYQMLLKRETFFNSNRAYLIAGLVTATLLPLAEYTKVILVEAKPVRPLTSAEMAYLANAMQNQALQPEETAFSWWYVAGAVYTIGVLFFGFSLLNDVFRIRKMLRGKQVIQQHPYKLVDSPSIQSPFSFFNYIVFNSNVVAPQELESIISHEKVHSRQKHSLDMLLAQLFCILFWFNPLVWLYKKAISQNLEFIADSEALKNVSDKTAYQKTMLRLAVQATQNSIINHFYQSLIKKRIVMLNTKKSKRRNSWKYAVVLPLLALFVMAFQVKTVAQEKQGAKQTVKKEEVSIQLEFNKDSKKEAIEANKKICADMGAELIVSNEKRNDKGEITALKVEIKGNGHDTVYNVSSSEPIKPFIVAVVQKNGKLEAVSVYPGTKNAPAGAVPAYTYDEENDELVPTPPTPPAPPGSPLSVPAPPAPPAPPAASGHAYGSTYNFNQDGDVVALNISDNTLVLLNGKKQEKGAPVRIPSGHEISAVNVLKGKDAKKKYGKEAKEGAIEITTKRSNGNSARGYGFSGMPNGTNNSTFTFTYPDDMIAQGQNFAFEMPDMQAFIDMSKMEFPDVEELREQIKNFNGGTQNMQNFTEYAEKMAERMRNRADDAHKQLNIERKKADEYRKAARSQNYGRNLSDETRKEMDDVRKEIEETRNELQKAREELKKEREKTRASMSKRA